MSGSIATPYPFPTNLETEPPGKEGSKVVSVSLNWTTVKAATGGTVATVNLLQQFLSGQFTTVQAIYIDNSANYFPVTVQSADSQQVISAAPFSQGMYTLISEAAASFIVTLGVVPYPAGNTISLGSTKLFFLNTPQKPYQTSQLAFGTNFQSVNGVVAQWTGTVQILPGLSGANQHYAISAFTLSVMAAGAAAQAAGPLSLVLADGAGTFYLWRDSFNSSGTAGLYYSRQTLFPTPSLQFTANNPLSLGTLTANGSTTLGYPASPGFYATWQITYGIVTIQ